CGQVLQEREVRRSMTHAHADQHAVHGRTTTPRHDQTVCHLPRAGTSTAAASATLPRAWEAPGPSRGGSAAAPTCVASAMEVEDHDGRGSTALPPGRRAPCAPAGSTRTGHAAGSTRTGHGAAEIGRAAC